MFSLWRRGRGDGERSEEVGAVALDATAIEQLVNAIMSQLEPQLVSVIQSFQEQLDLQKKRLDELSQSMAEHRRAGAEMAAEILKDVVVAFASRGGGVEVNLEPLTARMEQLTVAVQRLREDVPRSTAEQVAKSVAEQLAGPVEELRKAAADLAGAVDRLTKQLEQQEKRLSAVEAALKTLAESQKKVADQVAKAGGADQVAKALDQLAGEVRRAAEAAVRAASQAEGLSRRIDSILDDLAGRREEG